MIMKFSCISSISSTLYTFIIFVFILSSTSAQSYTHDQDLNPNATAIFPIIDSRNNPIFDADFAVFASLSNESTQHLALTLLLHGHGSPITPFNVSLISSFCLGYVFLLPRVQNDTVSQCSQQLSESCRTSLNSTLGQISTSNCSSTPIFNILQTKQCNNYAIGLTASNSTVALSHTGPFASNSSFPIEYGNFTANHYPLAGVNSPQYRNIVKSSVFFFFVANQISNTGTNGTVVITPQFNCKNLIVQPGSSSLAKHTIILWGWQVTLAMILFTTFILQW